ncbi:type II toxin-antitoxin system RelE/ParE family toxin [Leadbettera azotonutricia]|uniref:Plasmid stabilization system n=1 Tax=Leadbettera azotonutricia (strain ATCC BAA-888 / DSM 13862 / ZAS-9) TaxID=545695 RepID=F5YFC5_LEAAZ|nr:type II toxin-antitoxin system RelE/ParE family toxin [Leadbettera azotonutricia]AEF81974.1 plasmid stabilization system [Leadbettera azotonutricia ZAS-9]
MAYEVKLLKRSRIDIDEICQYKSQFYPGTVDRFLDKLEKELNSIADNPFICPEYYGNKKYHRLLVQDYLVFYRIFETAKTVRVYRILNGKRDIPAILS